MQPELVWGRQGQTLNHFLNFTIIFEFVPQNFSPKSPRFIYCNIHTAKPCSRGKEKKNPTYLSFCLAAGIRSSIAQLWVWGPGGGDENVISCSGVLGTNNSVLGINNAIGRATLSSIRLVYPLFSRGWSRERAKATRGLCSFQGASRLGFFLGTWRR